MLQQSEEENADEEFDFRPAGGEEDQSEQFMSRCYHVKRKNTKGDGRRRPRVNSSCQALNSSPQSLSEGLFTF